MKAPTFITLLGLGCSLAFSDPAPDSVSVPLASTVAPTIQTTVASEPLNALYFDLTRWVIVAAGGDIVIPSAYLTYERILGQSGFGLLTALHAGYLAEGGDTHYAFGLGLGLRHYLYRPNRGVFLQVTGDAGFVYADYGVPDSYYGENDEERYLLLAAEYGYKLQTKSFMASVHAGPAFYGFTDTKKLSFIAGIDLGFPFSSHSFDLPKAHGEKLKQSISIHPITSILFSGLSLSYTRPLKPGLGLEVPFYFGVNNQFFEQPRLFAGAGAGLRFYLDKAQSGGYIAPLVEVLNMTELSDKSNEDPERRDGGNAIITLTSLRYGYTFLWPDFVIDLGLGVAWLQAFGDVLNSNPKGMGITPAASISFGLPF